MRAFKGFARARLQAAKGVRENRRASVSPREIQISILGLIFAGEGGVIGSSSPAERFSCSRLRIPSAFRRMTNGIERARSRQSETPVIDPRVLTRGLVLVSHPRQLPTRADSRREHVHRGRALSYPTYDLRHYLRSLTLHAAKYSPQLGRRRRT